MTVAGRAGTYELQPGGHRAFIPRSLPPEPPFQNDDELRILLSQADRFLGRLDGSIQTLPNADLFVFMYVRKEAVLSSQIEGTQSSLNDVLEAEAEIFDPSRPRDVDEVLNYVRSMNYGLDRINQLPLSVRLIREIHAVLMQGVRGGTRDPGELRKIQNWIGPDGCTIGDATFVPPPPQSVQDHLSQLELFLHSDNLPVLIQVGLAHAQFETIHPFLDGNGRMGRLLIAFMLCQREILQTPVLYLSHYFKRHRQTYYERLQAVRDNGEWEAWIKFFLAGIIEVAREATATSRAIVDLRESHRDLITNKFGRVAANGLKVLERLYAKPIIRVQDIVDLTQVSYPAANNLMAKFLEHAILSETTGRTRNRQFRYVTYIDLFRE